MRHSSRRARPTPTGARAAGPSSPPPLVARPWVSCRAGFC
ncbi:hypothetical protein GL4_2601 [Methyloceanibacter caenitepidi]|uniref:Uncharacterized protein n=1 Tax=Methyloceanibacter caenitepidi TaxID=1384459 RepID=A0A0A8K551_9HYPH|nr:hypothetical protein GL4_2601 [Methyloceanibacter caenitepidi]